MFPELTNEEQDYVVQNIQAFFGTRCHG
jgi:dTDP-4-amino-4,6-dideoxygalactose transaminase